jgi:hypothetical protein
VKDGSAVIYHHVFALVMIRGLSNVGEYGQAKQCVIYAFDTDFILSVDRVMGTIIHQPHDLDAEEHGVLDNAAFGHTINAFLADRKRQGDRRPCNWVANKRHDKTKFPTKCGPCGDLNHVRSTCKALDADVLR